MRVGLPHLGQFVDLVVSISFLRSAVFAIFAIMIVLRSAGLPRGADIEDDCGISQRFQFTLKRETCRRSELPYDRLMRHELAKRGCARGAAYTLLAVELFQLLFGVDPDPIRLGMCFHSIQYPRISDLGRHIPWILSP